MKLLNVKYYSIGPYSPELVSIDFSEDGSMNQILGKNGVGKTTFLRVMKLGLYFETDGITVGKIANEINSNGYISIRLQSKGAIWTVESTYSPNKIRVFKNDSETPEDLGGLAETKKFVVSNICDMPYHIFNNVIFLSLNDFKSFLKMKAEDCRNIRDKIFGFHVTNEMSEVVRKNLAQIAGKFDELNLKIENSEQMVVKLKTEYEQKLIEKKEENELLVLQIKSDLESTSKLISETESKKQKLKSYFDELQAWIKIYSNESNKSELEELKTKQKQIETDLLVLDSKTVELRVLWEKLRDEKALFESKKMVSEYEVCNSELIKINERFTIFNNEFGDIKTTHQKLKESSVEYQEHVKLIQENKEILGYFTEYESFKVKTALDGESISGIEQNLKLFSEQKLEIDSEILKLETKLKSDQDRLLVFENGSCPTCGTELTETLHQEHKKEIEESIDIASSKLPGLKQTLQDLVHEIRVMSDDLQLKIKAKTEYDYRISQLGATLSKFDLENVKSELLESENFVNNFDLAQIDESKIKEIESKIVESENLEREKSIIEAKSSTLRNSVTTELIEKLSKAGFVYDDKSLYETELANVSTKGNAMVSEKNQTQTYLNDIKSKIIYLDSIVDMNLVLTPDIPNLETINGEIGNVDVELSGLESSIKEFTDKKSELSFKLNTLSEDNVSKYFESYILQINDHDNLIKALNLEISGTKNSVQHLKSLIWVLSDEGIKSYILKDIVPSINGEINRILSIFNIGLEAFFDDEFKVHIYRFGREADLSTISLGQTKIIDVTILTAITKILKMKYASLNVVFYDEVFSSIDSDNRVILLEVLNSICKDQLRLNTYIINHTYLPSSYFDSVINVVSRNNFSYMEVLTKDEYDSKYETNGTEEKVS